VTFGLFLVRLDVRQDAARHRDALTEITDYLGLGRYADWDEEQRIAFLQAELKTVGRCCLRISNRRPIPPKCWPPARSRRGARLPRWAPT
jgi:phosphoenolpyruvate carboxylase